MKTLLAFSMGLLLVTLWPALAIAEPPRLALLVGVSKYQQGPNAWRELHTESDITQMKEVLIRYHGFQSDSFRILLNEQATGEGIRRSFREHLIDKATPGSVIVFHFSGHGQQILDDNGDELDGLDESLVPYDTVSQQAAIAAKTNVRDDELGRWLHALRLKMTKGGKLRGSINVFLDSCYSGTATRGHLVERGRAWDADLDGPRPKTVVTGHSKGDVGLLSIDEVADGGFVLLSATRSYQTAKEVNGRGAFSLALIHALARVGPGMTMRSVFDRVTDEVAGLALFQDPVFEGPIDTLVFSGTAIAQPPYLRVETDPMQQGRLRLPVGEVHGTTVGSLYELHPAGSTALSNKERLGEAIVESVEPFVSWLRLRQKIGASLLAAARAVEVQHAPGDRKLRVHFLNLESLPTVRDRLLKLPIVEAATLTNHQIQVAYDAQKKRLLIRRVSAAQPIAELPADENAAMLIAKLLQGEWRWQHLSSLRSTDEALRVGVKLVPVQAVKESAGPDKGLVRTLPVPRSDVLPSRQLCLHRGDFFQVEFQNPSPAPQFVTLVELNPSGEINVLFPDSQKLDDSRIATGTHQLPYQPYVFEVTNPPGKTLYLAIATRQPIDFRSLILQSGQYERPVTDRPRSVVGSSGSWGITQAWLDVLTDGHACQQNSK